MGIPEVDTAVAGTRSMLQSGSSVSLTVYTEYLDQDRLGSDYLGSVADWYLEKYRGHKPDVIIAGGSSTVDFLLSSRPRLWPDVPIVFSTVDERILRRVPRGQQATGIVFYCPIPSE
jgi:hypothetical protein